MASARPELIVVAGPQAGARLVILDDISVAGRTADCQLILTENYVSRQQMKFTRTPDGWIVENISTNGTLINGKRYKAGKQVILDTGDVLGVGLETQILFVDAGDNPDDAMDAYRKAAAAAPAGAPVSQAPPPLTDGLPPAPGAAHGELPLPMRAGTAPPTDHMPTAAVANAQSGEKPPLRPDEVADQEQKKKYRRYGIALAASLLMTVGLVVVLKYVKTDTVLKPDSDTPARLSEREIEDALVALPEEVPPNETVAKAALERATAMAAGNLWLKTGDLYLCAKQYKLFRTYNPKLNWFWKGADIQIEFRKVINGMGKGREGLLPLVLGEYDNGWQCESHGKWRDARIHFQKVLDVVPEEDRRDPTYVSLLTNVQAHRLFVQKHIPVRR